MYTRLLYCFLSDIFDVRGFKGWCFPPHSSFFIDVKLLVIAMNINTVLVSNCLQVVCYNMCFWKGRNFFNGKSRKINK